MPQIYNQILFMCLFFKFLIILNYWHKISSFVPKNNPIYQLFYAMKPTYYTLLLLFMAFQKCGFAAILQPNTKPQAKEYHIKITVKGAQPGDTVFLITTFGTQQFATDTALLDAQTKAEFVGKTLHQGVAGFMLSDKSYLEFIMPANQNFEVTTEKNNLLAQAKFTNSPENTRFFGYLLQAQINRGQAQQLRAEQKSTKEIDSIFEANQAQFIAQNPEDLVTKILMLSKESELDNYRPRKTDGSLDTAKIMYFYSRNFWENTDFNDNRLIYTLALEPKIMRYITQIIPQIPDSLNAACDFMLEKCKKNPEMYEYLLRKLASTYEQPKVMGTDAVFVYLVEKYFKDLASVPFFTEPELLRIRQKANELAPSLLGKTAPDIVLQNENGQTFSVYGLQKEYTVLYFFDPNCGKCQKITPEVLGVYKKYAGEPKLGFVSVCNAPEEANWRKYIVEKGLTWLNLYDFSGSYAFRSGYNIDQVPKVVVIDKNHKIVAKNLDAETLDLFLKNNLKLNP